MLHRLRGLGLSARVFEAGKGVGGTWYWNRYPGARCDVESMDYSYSFSDELQQEWHWTERYASQPEILRYINHVADRFDLRRDIQLETRVTAAVFDEATSRWTIRDRPRRSGLGAVLHHGDGLPVRRAGARTSRASRRFEGECVPHRPLAARGRRLHRPARRRHRHGLVRHPVDPDHRQAGRAPLPSSSGRRTSASPRATRPLDPEFERQREGELRRASGARRASRASASSSSATTQSALEVPPEERQREYEERWSRGGLGFAATFTDLADQQGGQRHRRRVRPRQDPRDRPRPGGRRDAVRRRTIRSAPSACASTPSYYETFNRDNVTLVDISKPPIEEITPTGLRTRGRGVRARQHRVRHRLRRDDRRAARASTSAAEAARRC